MNPVIDLTMKTSERIKKLKIGNYLRELSIVVLGVAVTLFASGKINERAAQNDLKLQLRAVYAELESNMEELDRTIHNFTETRALSRYLLQNAETGWSNDTIAKYSGIISNISNFAYKKSAYEMVVNSGAMRLIGNGRHLLDITEAYSLLEITKEVGEFYNGAKSQELMKLYDYELTAIFNLDVHNPIYHRLFNFLAGTSGMEEPAKEADRLIRKILSEKII